MSAAPCIAILLATYNPDTVWLRRQLLSLNGQNWENLRLYVRDDASTTITSEELRSILAECVTAFPYSFAVNERNLGSNATFERLTAEAEGEYFAYCDQDDIWHPRKLCISFAALCRSRAELVCSDVRIIDAEDRPVADSITDIRRHHVFREGAGLAPRLLVHNFVIGCTVLLPAVTAKAAVPFCPYMVHDHWLALFCAERGSIACVHEPLMDYRVHSGNQTGLLAGVTDKRSYSEVRIELLRRRFRWLREHFSCGTETAHALAEATLWADARYENWHHMGGKAFLWKYRHFSPLASVLELGGSRLPESIFAAALRAARKNRI